MDAHSSRLLDSLIAALASSRPVNVDGGRAEKNEVRDWLREASARLCWSVAVASGRARPGDDHTLAFIGSPPRVEGRQGKALSSVLERVEAKALSTFSAYDLVYAYERLLEAGIGQDGKKAQGAIYTPRAIAEELAEKTLAPLLEDERMPVVCDPACGAGVFLVAAHAVMARKLLSVGVLDSEARKLAAQQVVGLDIDRAAVETARVAVWLQSGLPWQSLPLLPGFYVGDVLCGALDEIGRKFDAVITNPPFLAQLKSSSAHSRGVRLWLRERFGLKGYADAAAAFLLACIDCTRPGGRCSVILPLSFLSSRDAGPVRRKVAEQASLDAVWMPTEKVFCGASVFVFAPILDVQRVRGGSVQRYKGNEFEQAGGVPATAFANGGSWSPLVADLFGLPVVALESQGRKVGDVAAVSAGFRDQFYGLVGFVVDREDMPDDAFPKLVTSGLVDLAAILWGRRAMRFAKSRFEKPRVDVQRLEASGTLGEWPRCLLKPKVVVATQTRVVEAAVDEDGVYVPGVPLISVVPDRPEDAWLLAAAIASPPVSAHAAANYLGSALSVSAIKLSAQQVREIPLPHDKTAWEVGAEEFKQAQANPGKRKEHLLRYGEAMCEAYGVSPGNVMPWWSKYAV